MEDATVAPLNYWHTILALQAEPCQFETGVEEVEDLTIKVPLEDLAFRGRVDGPKRTLLIINRDYHIPMLNLIVDAIEYLVETQEAE